MFPVESHGEFFTKGCIVVTLISRIIIVESLKRASHFSRFLSLSI